MNADAVDAEGVSRCHKRLYTENGRDQRWWPFEGDPRGYRWWV